MFMSVPYSVSFNGDDAISFETENVLVRRFQKEDWMDLKGIAVSNANSPFADCDANGRRRRAGNDGIFCKWRAVLGD